MLSLFYLLDSRLQYNARNSADMKLVIKVPQWRKIGMRERRRNDRGALNLRVASFAGNSERNFRALYCALSCVLEQYCGIHQSSFCSILFQVNSDLEQNGTRTVNRITVSSRQEQRQKKGKAIADHEGCTFYGFMGGLTGTTSIGTLAAIALDRYWAVVRPLEPLRALTAVRARLLAAAAWVYASAFAAIPALDVGVGRYVPEGYLTSCSFDYLTSEWPPRYFIFAFFCAAWLAPFCTISFCYLNILRVVVYSRNVAAKNQQQLSSRHIKEQTKRKAEVKLAVLVIAVIALFFVSWTPYAVVALLGIFGQKDIITPTMSMVPALFCKTAACINPFIYIITHPNFRKEICKMLHRGTSRRSRGTLRTTVYNTEVLKHRPSKDLSDTEVEMLEMKDIPYHNDRNVSDVPQEVKTIAGRVATREGSQRSISLKSFEDEAVAPPSWFAKPNFSKRRSFQKQSTKSIVSVNTDPTSK
ncbi:Rhodopsin [Eumeta japonica]|uniref:Rhodopsin n=1 Tax=Eumeta variegata TaxID=151549 RepID=A0A4C1X6Q1_EUMVA|nr:Rhodopsin [Eumeta japonica]